VSDIFETKFLNLGLAATKPKFLPFSCFGKKTLDSCYFILFFLSKSQSTSFHKLNIINFLIIMEHNNNFVYPINGVVKDYEDNNTPVIIVDNSPSNDDIVTAGVDDAGKKHGSSFTNNKHLLVCKAWIYASEDKQVGAYQKAAVFKHKVWTCYVQLLCEQERMDVIR
jgi:hypothetical protein